jgi:hypothetical protein
VLQQTSVSGDRIRHLIHTRINEAWLNADWSSLDRLGHYNNDTTSAAIKAVNGLLQLAGRRARGYRTFRNFHATAYWVAGGLTIEIRPATTSLKTQQRLRKN